MIGGALLISVRKEVPKLGGNRLRHPHLDNAKTNWKQKAVQPRLRALGSSQYGLMSRQRKTRRNPLSQKKRIPHSPTREMLIRSLILEEWAGQCMALTLFWPAARKKKKRIGIDAALRTVARTKRDHNADSACHGRHAATTCRRMLP